MKAIIQHKYGSADDLELRDVDTPVPLADQVLVRVRATSVHADIWHVVTGWPWILRLMGGGYSRPKNPIPGTDMAGIVESVGQDVTRFKPGDEVFGETIGNMQWVNGGAWAEYVAVAQDSLALKPDNITFEQAASVPTSGYIALMNLRSQGDVRPGQRVLINGAAGCVGALALQLVKAYGAHVTAVDSTAKLDLLRSLGADEVVDYTEEDFTARGERYDLIFDVPGNYPFSKCRRALTPEGKYVLIGYEYFGASGRRIMGLVPHMMGLMARAVFAKQLPRPGFEMPTKEDVMAVFRELLEAGKITPIIDRTFPLAEAPDALRYLQTVPPGRVIITP